MGDYPFAAPSAAALTLLAATPVAGFALANGTPTILSWTAPSDGGQHRVFLAIIQHVTSPENGGQIAASWAGPDGASFFPSAIFGGGSGTGQQAAAPPPAIVGSGQTYTLAQGSALTGGAAKVWAELWGS